MTTVEDRLKALEDAAIQEAQNSAFDAKMLGVNMTNLQSRLTRIEDRLSLYRQGTLDEMSHQSSEKAQVHPEHPACPDNIQTILDNLDGSLQDLRNDICSLKQQVGCLTPDKVSSAMLGGFESLAARIDDLNGKVKNLRDLQVQQDSHNLTFRTAIEQLASRLDQNERDHTALRSFLQETAQKVAAVENKTVMMEESRKRESVRLDCRIDLVADIIREIKTSAPSTVKSVEPDPAWNRCRVRAQWNMPSSSPGHVQAWWEEESPYSLGRSSASLQYLKQLVELAPAMQNFIQACGSIKESDELFDWVTNHIEDVLIEEDEHGDKEGPHD